MVRLSSNGDAIEIQGLVKSYGSTPVLRKLDLTLHWGECLTLIGANGSGKTTLMKILATMAKPDDGTVWVAGYDVRRQAASMRTAVGVLGHKTWLYEDLTPEENLRFYGQIYGVPRLERRIREMLAQLGMEQYAKQKVRTLSHGMQKRVSLCRVFLHDPSVILLDEPETGLDQGTLNMLDHILRSTLARGRAILMTTHNVHRSVAMAHSVAILSNGRLSFGNGHTGRDASRLRDDFLSNTEMSQ